MSSHKRDVSTPNFCHCCATVLLGLCVVRTWLCGIDTPGGGMQEADYWCFSAYKLSSVNTKATVLTGVSDEFYLWGKQFKVLAEEY